MGLPDNDLRQEEVVQLASSPFGEASFSFIRDLMVVPLLENKRRNRPKWRFRTSEIHY
ncbi:MAG: hypothetical protein ACJAYF_001112 [Arenicella sp.]|jgi:hypothetical protein